MAWEIKGESGATLNGTLRDLDSLNIGPWELTLASLADDTLTWTAATDDATGAGTIIPDAGQRIELWLDGVRKFRGNAVKPQVGLTEVSVEARGPWWWMDRIDLSGELTDGEGTTDDRTSYVLPTQNLRVSLRALIDRAIAKGVPITRGDVDDCYAVPKITLSNMSFAAALAELMRWVPDAVAWFDYSDDAALPELNITRRGTMTPLEMTIGTDNLTSVNIRPRLDQQVQRVELNYVTRNSRTGKTQFAKQSNGTAADGKVQIITISGPEIAAILPKDDFESKSIKTAPEDDFVTHDYVAANDSTLAQIKKEYGLTGGIGTTFRTYSQETTSTGGPLRVVTRTYNFPGLAFQRDNGNYINDLTGKFLVISADLPEWAKKQWNGVSVTITGTWLAFWNYATQGDYFSDGYELLRGGLRAVQQYGSGDFSPSVSGDNRAWTARPFSCRGVLIESVAGMPDNPPWAAGRTVYKQWDYDYLTPPADLAQNLKEAQNWVAYEGQIQRVADDVTGFLALRRSMNVVGGYADYDGMDALISSVSYDGFRGRTTYNLGSPARVDFASLVGRIRREPQDNIVYL